MRVIGPIESGSIDTAWLKMRYLETKVDGKPLRYVESNRLSTKRMETLFSKEPTTIPWLDSIEPGEVLVDVGANVGIYSIYAGLIRGAEVHAFEPEALNYAELNKNIYINSMHDRVTAWCMAMLDRHEVDRLFLGGFAEGLSHHDFGENTWKADKDFGPLQTRKDARLRQGCVSYSLDALVADGSIPAPHHIKIDVDGLEHLVVNGCQGQLTGEDLKSILVEVSFESGHSSYIIELMTSLGWRFSYDQLCANRKGILKPEDIERMREARKGGFNYIFFRSDDYVALFADYLEDFEPPMAPKAG